MTGRVAAIDCGTNSIRLLIAEAGPHGRLDEVHRDLVIVRLGQGIDATGEFHPDALDRTFAAVDGFADQIGAAAVNRIRFVATSAARDARNRSDFFAGIRHRLGVRPEVISGDEEARLSFLGAVRGIPDAAEPVLVMDIGGGSTELIVGRVDAAGEPAIGRAVSLDIGSVRVTERFWHSDPPDESQVGKAADHIDRLLDLSDIEFDLVATWIGVAGTVTSMSAISQDLPGYDRSKVHGSRLAVEEVQSLAHRLRTTEVARLRELGSLHPQRADVIGAGSLIADRVSRRLDVEELVVSESDVLDGIAIGLLLDPRRSTHRRR